MMNLPILSISILLPLFSALYITLFISHTKSSRKQIYAMYVAILASVLTFIATTYLLVSFDPEVTDFQFVERYHWIDSIGLEFYVGVDGLSIYFVFLSALLTLICIIASLFTIKKNIKEFLLCFLLLEAFCIGAFLSLNLLLFYGFFEVILIPMFLIIGIWGGENRVYAAVKFFLYTFFGSVFLLIALIYIYSQTGTFSIIDLVDIVPGFSLKVQQYLWLATFVSFAVKVPMVPFHTWLPDAHVQAPTAGSVMLAGILLKLGGYAFLRVSLPMLPGASEYFAIYVLWISGFAVTYASLVALAQTDMKKMIAYSSVAHMGYVTAGIFSFTVIGIGGAVFQMISHGVISSALFLVVGMLYERHHTKEIAKYGGVAASMPVLATFFMIAMLGSIGLPGLSGFVGEFLSIVGVFGVSPAVGIMCAFGVILGAIYMLKLYKSIMFGEISDAAIINFDDLKAYEKTALVPLMLLIIYIGLVPNGILETINTPARHLAEIYGVL
ncbi:MAG: NADH-quinone oxidoreductase subunit M [Rickettsiaceae bacterium]|nr:NADH-quinone oxidoreductase subunit M [Rickettsiaceae bacterium]MDP5020214.1 NADH-quinone oxidoreductase subunit M [Rickettsiaceae bacterium]MDP5082890.1 NADH-quinone oxidoreductase subunit M [Rickettsiaceae bacterium]